MGTSYSPNIVKDGLVFLIDAANPRSTIPSASTTKTFNLKNTAISGSFINDTMYDSGSISPSYAFDGVGDYINTNYTIPTISKWSVSFWTYVIDPSNANYYYYVNARNSSTQGLIVWSGNGSSSSQRNFTAKINSTTITFSITSFSTWYNIIVTGDSSNLTAYVDGSQVATTTISTLFPTLSYTTKFGSNKDGSNYFFKGNMGPTQIYNSALSAQEVKQNYNALKRRFI